MFKMHRTGAPLAAIILSLAVPVAALAADTAAVAGDWIGTLERNGRPVPVTLKINDVGPGVPAGELTFGEPDQCTNGFKLQDARKLVFALDSSNGGRCGSYTLGTMTLTKGADGRLNLSVASAKASETAVLAAAAAAPTSAPAAGTWNGSYAGRNGPVPLTLVVEGVKPGQKAGKLTFAAPDSCANDLQFSGVTSTGALVFTPSASNGGRCQNNLFGTLTMAPAPGGYTIVMADRSGAKRFDSTLGK